MQVFIDGTDGSLDDDLGLHSASPDVKSLVGGAKMRRNVFGAFKDLHWASAVDRAATSIRSS